MRTTRRFVGAFFGAAVALALVSTPVSAGENFDYTQMDFSAQTGVLKMDARTFAGGDISYWHIGAEYQPLENLTVGVRYADIDSLVNEYRATVSYTQKVNDWAYVQPIMSYHYLDGERLVKRLGRSNNYRHYGGPDSLDVWRLGLRVGAEHTYKDVWKVFAWHEPRFTFGGDTEEFNFAGSKTEFGVSYGFKGVDFGPFLQVNTDDGYSDSRTLLGTKMSATF